MNKKRDRDSINTVNSIYAGIAGAAAVTAAIVLLNKNNRTKVKAMIDNFFEEGEKKMEELESKIDETKKIGKKKLLDKTKKLESNLQDK